MSTSPHIGCTLAHPFEATPHTFVHPPFLVHSHMACIGGSQVSLRGHMASHYEDS